MGIRWWGGGNGVLFLTVSAVVLYLATVVYIWTLRRRLCRRRRAMALRGSPPGVPVEEARALMGTGDLLLVQGTDALATMVCLMSGSVYSHVAVVLWRPKADLCRRLGAATAADGSDHVYVVEVQPPGPIQLLALDDWIRMYNLPVPDAGWCETGVCRSGSVLLWRKMVPRLGGCVHPRGLPMTEVLENVLQRYHREARYPTPVEAVVARSTAAAVAQVRPHCANVTGTLLMECLLVSSTSDRPAAAASTSSWLIPESFASTHGWIDDTMARLGLGLFAPERCLVVPPTESCGRRGDEGLDDVQGPDQHPQEHGQTQQPAEPRAVAPPGGEEGRATEQDDDALEEGVVAVEAAARVEQPQVGQDGEDEQVKPQDAEQEEKQDGGVARR